MELSMLWSKSFLTSRSILWLLLLVNLFGTVYGYQWYWNQMVYTFHHESFLLLPYVPDSPTASLFFTISLLFLLYPRVMNRGLLLWIKTAIFALAVMTSVKYGVWAVVMIFAAAFQGEPIVWQDWMLICSHTAMAVEALLFMRFFRLTLVPVIAAAIWTMSNDYIDYTYEVYPWLPRVLDNDLQAITLITFALSVLGVTLANVGMIAGKKKV